MSKTFNTNTDSHPVEIPACGFRARGNDKNGATRNYKNRRTRFRNRRYAASNAAPVDMTKT